MLIFLHEYFYVFYRSKFTLNNESMKRKIWKQSVCYSKYFKTLFAFKPMWCAILSAFYSVPYRSQIASKLICITSTWTLIWREGVNGRSKSVTESSFYIFLRALEHSTEVEIKLHRMSALQEFLWSGVCT